MSTTLPRRRRVGLARRVEPYAYVAPTSALLVVLMLVPIVMVIGYSFLDNVILNKNPEVVGFDNYVEVLTDERVPHRDRQHVRVRHRQRRGAPADRPRVRPDAELDPARSAHHLACSAACTSCRGCSPPPIVAVLWRMLLAPNGVANFLLGSLGLTTGDTEWLADPSLALGTVTFINIWSGYPFFMISLLAGLQGISADLHEAATGRRRGPAAAVLERHHPAAAADHHLDGAARLHLDLAAVRPDLDDDRAAARSSPPRCSAPTPTSSRSRSTSSPWPPRAPCSCCCCRWCSPSSTCVTRGRGTETMAVTRRTRQNLSRAALHRRARCRRTVRRRSRDLDALELVQAEHPDLRVPAAAHHRGLLVRGLRGDLRRPREDPLLHQQLRGVGRRHDR